MTVKAISDRPTPDTWRGFPVVFDATMPDDCIGMRGANGEALFIFIQEEAQRILRLQSELVERRILEGDNRVVIKTGDRSCIHTVPTWKRRPVARFKVERARRHYRRSHR